MAQSSVFILCQKNYLHHSNIVDIISIKKNGHFCSLKFSTTMKLFKNIMPMMQLRFLINPLAKKLEKSDLLIGK